MRIGLVWFNDYPWDVRLDKQARSLVNHGHQVIVICKSLTDRPARETLADGVIVVRHTVGRNRFGRLLSAHLPWNPLWVFWLRRDYRRYAPDILVVRDLPLLLPAARAVRRKIPVLLDMAENYPAGLMIWKPWLPRWAIALARLVEARSVRIADGIITVVDKQVERLGRSYGANAAAKTVVVENTPELSCADLDGGGSSHARGEDSGRFLLLFTGVMGRDRGLDLVIKALPGLRDHIPEIRLRLVGDGGELPYLQTLAKSLSVEDLVEFTGRVPHAEVYRHINEADVCLIPHPHCEHVATTMPNKIYDYMLVGRPVLCTDSPPLARLIADTGGGLSFRSGSADDFIDKVLQLFRDPMARIRMGANGRQAVLTKYNWDRDSDKFVRFIEKYRNWTT